MAHKTQRNAVAALTATVILFAATITRATIEANTIVATFENYSEGGLSTTQFTDPLSGITFSNPTSINHNFVIEGTTLAYSALPSITPGHYLKSNGFAPGDGISASPNTGFTASLPTLAAIIAMDIVYVSSGSLQVKAYDDNNVLVAMTTVTPPAGSFVETHVSLASTASNIRHFETISTLTGIGYDNISYTIPEPGAGMLTALPLFGGAVTLRRRR